MSTVFPAEFLTGFPSLVHVMRGKGTPLTAHVMFICLSTSAVILSPMMMGSGVPSPNGTFLGVSEVAICGFTGSTTRVKGR